VLPVRLFRSWAFSSGNAAGVLNVRSLRRVMVSRIGERPLVVAGLAFPARSLMPVTCVGA